VCIAKTQYSFSTDPALRGAPSGHTVNIREVRLAAGAEFIVMVCGDVMTMPGLPKVPSADKIDIDAEGRVVGVLVLARHCPRIAPDGDSRLGAHRGRGQLLAAVVAQLGDFDLSALRRDDEACLADGTDAADGTLDLTEGACRMLARAMQLQFPALECRPRRR
jgi:hypothetical protein